MGEPNHHNSWDLKTQVLLKQESKSTRNVCELLNFLNQNFCTYLLKHFFVQGFSMPYRIDMNRNKGVMMEDVREDIPSKIFVNHKRINYLIILRVYSLKWIFGELKGFWNLPRPLHKMINTSAWENFRNMQVLWWNYFNWRF